MPRSTDGAPCIMTYPESNLEPAPRLAGTARRRASCDPLNGSQASEVVGICIPFIRRPPRTLHHLSVTLNSACSQT
jgi:hypothetical protein